MKLKNFNKELSIIIISIFLGSLISCKSDEFTNESVSEIEKPVHKRSNEYIDDTQDGYMSGWKAILTNAYPDKLLTNGRWFESSKQPIAFKRGNVKPFSEDLKQKLKNNSTDAVLVVLNNEIVGEYFRYGFAYDDIHLIHSSGKTFTSFAMQPVYDAIGDEGLKKQLKDYLPELENTSTGTATLAQALDMTAAVEWSENYDDPASATMISAPIGGWEPIPDGEELKSWYTMFNYPKTGEHGKVWSYNNATIVAASFTAEAISKKHFSQLVQESYDKLGFEDKSFYVQNKLNELSAEGGQAITIRDFVKLGRYMLKTKDSKYVDDVWRMDGENVDLMPEKYQGVAKNGYKCYWYRFDDNVILAIGSSGQFLYVDKEKGLIIGKYSSYVQGQGAYEGGQSLEILLEIAGLYH